MNERETQQEIPRPSVFEGLINIRQHEVQEDRLTSVEIGSLWNAYMSESFVHHLFVYFLKHMEDPVIKPTLINLVDATKDVLYLLKSVFEKEGIPVPRGFTSEDINLNAPRLFSDTFLIPLLKSMAKVSLQFFSLSYIDSTRKDMREFFRDALDRLVMHNQQAAELMLAKGTPVPPPYIPIPKKVDFVKNQDFLAGFFGDKRPLSVLEINDIFLNAQSNALGKAILLGYSQVVKSTEIKKFITSLLAVSNKYYADLTKILLHENITVPPSMDGEVLDSTESPISDRMILYHSNFMVSLGLQSYGMAIGMSPRRDLAVMYAKMMAEVGTYANKGAKLMIKNKWMEQPPLAPDRDALQKQDNKSPYGHH